MPIIDSPGRRPMRSASREPYAMRRCANFSPGMASCRVPLEVTDKIGNKTAPVS
jgi:hypothetical protein